MIHLIDISKRYGPQTLFEGLSWTLGAGERIALVGPNGAGKTTLCRMICEEELPDDGEISKPKGVKVGYLKQDVAETPSGTILDRAMAAFAEVRRQVEELEAIQHQVADAVGTEQEILLERMGRLQAQVEQMGGYGVEAEARRVLAGLGFATDEVDKPLKELSGGWRMRVELAHLLLGQPDLLILDEPTNHLDLPSLEWFEGFLEQFRGTLLVVSHDRWFLGRIANRVAELALGRLKVFTGNFESYLEQRAAHQAQLEKLKKQQDREIKAAEDFIDRFRYKASKAKAVQSRIKALEKVERVELEADAAQLQGFRFPQPPRSGREVVRLEGASKAYGEKVVYDGLDFLLERGTRMALVGPNGAGKSTLLKMMAGKLEPDSGVCLAGHNVSISHFAQHQVESLDVKKSIYEEIASAASMQMMPRLRSLLGAFMFSGDTIEKRIGVLSGGEKSRVALAKMLLEAVNLILLDEPTNHLDMSSRQVLMEALAAFEGTLCFISHDRHFINGVATHVAEVQDGQVRIFPGNFDAYAWKKKKEGVEAVAAPTRNLPASPQAVKSGPVKDVLSRKDRRRLEAELRKKHQATLKPLKSRFAKLEEEIGQLEGRLEEIVTLQEDPTFFEDGEKVQAIYAEQGVAQSKLDRAMEAWETVGTTLEEAEAALQSELDALDR